MSLLTDLDLFVYLGFYDAFNTVQVISRRVVGRAEETSTYSSLGLCTVNCQPTASNYQLSHLRPSRGSNPGLRGGRRECLTNLELPSIPEKQTCPCCKLPCLGIQIDLDTNTLSIHTEKLHSIHVECLATSDEPHLTREAFQSLLGK